jgi:hypothetical protein
MCENIYGEKRGMEVCYILNPLEREDITILSLKLTSHVAVMESRVRRVSVNRGGPLPLPHTHRNIEFVPIFEEEE